MKKILLIFIIVTSVLFGSCSTETSDTQSNEKQQSKESSIKKDTSVSMDFYNYLKNNKSCNIHVSLLKLEDVLYLKKYDKSEGCIEKIEHGKSEIIFKQQNENVTDDFFFDYFLDGKLMVDFYKDSYFDFNKCQIMNINGVKSPDEDTYIVFSDNNLRYFVNNDKLYQYKDGKHQLLMTSNDLKMKIPNYLSCFYLNDKSFYCERTDDKNIYLCKFDFATKKYKNIKICQFDNKDSDLLDFPQITSFLVNGENVYVNLENRIYQINTSNDNVDLLFETAKERIVTINYSKDNLFIGEKNSPTINNSSESNCIYSLNTKTQKINKCYEKSFFEFYIYDENYIYIHNLEDDGKSSIIQLSQDGKTEKVIYAD